VRPRIGITVHVDAESEDTADSHYRVATRYARAVVAAGGVPMLLPSRPEAGGTAAEAVAAVDGLLLSGGRGDRRLRFASGASPTLRDTDAVRYDYEVGLVRAAWAEGLPVLGICRGYQTLVEAAGGSLVPRLETSGRAAVNHDQDDEPVVPTHGLRLERRSGLGSLFASGSDVRVNSFHRQGVAREPDGYRVSAWSPDDLIEAVESVDGATVGVQFHPEWLHDDEPRWLGVFSGLVARATRRPR
jgi:putative glutamine amidotransferase